MATARADPLVDDACDLIARRVVEESDRTDADARAVRRAAARGGAAATATLPVHAVVSMPAIVRVAISAGERALLPRVYGGGNRRTWTIDDGSSVEPREGP